MDCIGWIVSLDCWILLDLDPLGWIGWIGLAGSAGLDNNGWMRTHSFCKDGTDGMDGLDGALVALGWDKRSLAPSGTGSSEQEYTIDWLVTAIMGRMRRMDWVGCWWDRGGTDER